MATRHVISGVTFTNSIGKSMPDIPGLLPIAAVILLFFGA